MTAQVHEKLLLDGAETLMACTPEIPANHPLIEDLGWRGEGPSQDMILTSTACWRHYIGTWEVRDKRLFLRAIRGRYRMKTADPIHAAWFSGLLRVPIGKQTSYVHMGFGSEYAAERLIEVRNGEVVSSAVVKPNECVTCGGQVLPIASSQVAPVLHTAVVTLASVVFAATIYWSWTAWWWLTLFFGTLLGTIGAALTYACALQVFGIPSNPVRCSSCGNTYDKYAYLNRR